MNYATTRNLILTVIAFALLWTFPYLEKLNNPNENVRLYMTMSIVDHGSLAIHRRDILRDGKRVDHGFLYDRFGYVNDKAIVCDDPTKKGPDCSGDLFAAKAPGTSYLGVPVYAAVKAAHGDGADTLTKRQLLFWMRLFVVILPSILLLWAFARHLERRIASPVVRHLTLLALGCGSLFFNYATTYAGHTPSAVFLGSSWLALAAIERDRRPLGAAFLAGLFAAGAVMMEYPSALGAALLFLWLLIRGGSLPRGRWRLLGTFVLGSIIPVALLAFYHYECFGAVWRTPYSFLENPGFVSDIAPGVMGIHAPNMKAFVGSFFAPYNGLFFFAPWTLLTVAAAVTLLVGWIRTRGSGRTPSSELSLHLAIVFVYGLFISSHSLWRGGWTVGPRYIVMGVPFMALAVAHAADRWWKVAPRTTGTTLGALTLASVLIAVAVAQTSQGFPHEYYSPVFEFTWPMLRDGYVYPNIGSITGLQGLASLIPLALVLLVGALLALGLFKRASKAPMILTVALAFLVLATLSELSAEPWNRAKTGGITWQRRSWPEAQTAPDQTRFLELQKLQKERKLEQPERNELVRLTASRGGKDDLRKAWREALR